MSEIVKNFLLEGDKFMAKIHLKQLVWLMWIQGIFIKTS